MSHYAVIKVEFQNAEYLREALKRAGVKEEHIETHAKPVAISNYMGKESSNMAHVVIRRQHVGHLCNDIGFFCDAKNSQAFTCDFAEQAGFDDKWRGKVKQEYAVEATTRHYAKQGKSVRRVDDAVHEKVHLFVNA